MHTPIFKWDRERIYIYSIYISYILFLYIYTLYIYIYINTMQLLVLLSESFRRDKSLT